MKLIIFLDDISSANNSTLNKATVAPLTSRLTGSYVTRLWVPIQQLDLCWAGSSVPNQRWTVQLLGLLKCIDQQSMFFNKLYFFTQGYTGIIYPIYLSHRSCPIFNGWPNPIFGSESTPLLQCGRGVLKSLPQLGVPGDMSERCDSDETPWDT